MCRKGLRIHLWSTCSGVEHWSRFGSSRWSSSRNWSTGTVDYSSRAKRSQYHLSRAGPCRGNDRCQRASSHRQVWRAWIWKRSSRRRSRRTRGCDATIQPWMLQTLHCAHPLWLVQYYLYPPRSGRRSRNSSHLVQWKTKGTIHAIWWVEASASSADGKQQHPSSLIRACESVWNPGDSCWWMCSYQAFAFVSLYFYSMSHASDWRLLKIFAVAARRVTFDSWFRGSRLEKIVSKDLWISPRHGHGHERGALYLYLLPYLLSMNTRASVTAPDYLLQPSSLPPPIQEHLLFLQSISNCSYWHSKWIFFAFRLLVSGLSSCSREVLVGLCPRGLWTLGPCRLDTAARRPSSGDCSECSSRWHRRNGRMFSTLPSRAGISRRRCHETECGYWCRRKHCRPAWLIQHCSSRSPWCPCAKIWRISTQLPRFGSWKPSWSSHISCRAPLYFVL